MKIYLLIITVFATITVACKGKNSTLETTQSTSNSADNTIEQRIMEEEADQDEIILLGYQTKDSLRKAPYNSWFDETYQNYQPAEDVLKKLQPLLQAVTIKAFMGTWCEDSQREIPAFYKILEMSGYHPNNLTLITVSRDKDTPTGLEKGLNIDYVPTLIFYKNQKEVGRIVESTRESLEKDMLTILSGKPYKHIYAD